MTRGFEESVRIIERSSVRDACPVFEEVARSLLERLPDPSGETATQLAILISALERAATAGPVPGVPSRTPSRPDRRPEGSVSDAAVRPVRARNMARQTATDADTAGCGCLLGLALVVLLMFVGWVMSVH